MQLGPIEGKTRYMFKRTLSLSNAFLRSRPIIVKFM